MIYMDNFVVGFFQIVLQEFFIFCFFYFKLPNVKSW